MQHAHYGAMESHGSPVLITLAIALIALLYLRGWYRVRPSSLRASAWQGFSFLLGIFLVWVAVASPIAALDHQLLTIHMIQHLLLMTVAPALIWLGAPIAPLSQGLPQEFVRRAIRPAFSWPAVQRFGTALTQPALCWLAATAVLMGWHVPAAFTIGLHSAVWHSVQQASFFVAGLLFWWPVIQPWPSVSRWPEWSMILYLFFATVPCDILSGLLVFGDRVVYPVYSSSQHMYNLSALEDQQCASALMWTLVTVIYLVAGVILAARLLSPKASHVGDSAPSGSLESVVSQPNPHSLEVAWHGN